MVSTSSRSPRHPPHPTPLPPPILPPQRNPIPSLTATRLGKLSLHAPMQQELRLLLPHGHDILQDGRRLGSARARPARRRRDEEDQLRRGRAVPAPDVPGPAEPVLQGGPAAGVGVGGDEREPGAGGLAADVRAVRRHRGGVVRFLRRGDERGDRARERRQRPPAAADRGVVRGGRGALQAEHGGVSAESRGGHERRGGGAAAVPVEVLPGADGGGGERFREDVAGWAALSDHGRGVRGVLRAACGAGVFGAGVEPGDGEVVPDSGRVYALSRSGGEDAVAVHLRRGGRSGVGEGVLGSGELCGTRGIV